MAERGTLGPPSLGQQVNLLLGKMSLVSQGTTSSLGAIKGGDDNSAPPGAWRDEVSLADEWRGIFERMVKAGEVGLERAQRSTRNLTNKEDRDYRILNVWPNNTSDARLVAYVEGIPEDYILKLWRRQGVG